MRLDGFSCSISSALSSSTVFSTLLLWRGLFRNGTRHLAVLVLLTTAYMLVIHKVHLLKESRDRKEAFSRFPMTCSGQVRAAFLCAARRCGAGG